jgi:hypothetical protein
MRISAASLPTEITEGRLDFFFMPAPGVNAVHDELHDPPLGCGVAGL